MLLASSVKQKESRERVVMQGRQALVCCRVRCSQQAGDVRLGYSALGAKVLEECRPGRDWMLFLPDELVGRRAIGSQW